MREVVLNVLSKWSVAFDEGGESFKAGGHVGQVVVQATAEQAVLKSPLDRIRQRDALEAHDDDGDVLLRAEREVPPGDGFG